MALLLCTQLLLSSAHPHFIGPQAPSHQAPKAVVCSVRCGKALQVSFLQALSMTKLYPLPSFFQSSNRNHQISLCFEKKVEITINWLDTFLSVRLKKLGCLLDFKFLLQIWVNASGGGGKRKEDPKGLSSSMKKAVRNTDIENKMVVTNQECW